MWFGEYAPNERLTAEDSQSVKVPHPSTVMPGQPGETEESTTDIKNQGEEIPVRKAADKPQVSASQVHTQTKYRMIAPRPNTETYTTLTPKELHRQRLVATRNEITSKLVAKYDYCLEFGRRITELRRLFDTLCETISTEHATYRREWADDLQEQLDKMRRCVAQDHAELNALRARHREVTLELEGLP
ncbi:hypothetical protein N7474_001653 [Penicillium riverlandense]|uniref:uncharacterized protein n=1 Tax=Penicillium riverlandense TaxID=1903569 RepID=UPI002549B2C3|nr:uncharacterized protein N7474_001653 [Penicillium riverlandense]KAJ5833342.1 hypothetical protein N7474_001653 [Penicillium riverlandense]